MNSKIKVCVLFEFGHILLALDSLNNTQTLIFEFILQVEYQICFSFFSFILLPKHHGIAFIFISVHPWWIKG